MRASSLWQRVSSAIVLLPLVLGIIWWNPWAVTLIVGLLIIVGVLELYAAFQHAGYQPLRPIGILSAVLLYAALIVEHWYRQPFTWIALVLLVMAYLIAALPIHARKGLLADLGLTMLGALYVGSLAAPIAFLRFLETPLNPAPFSNFGMTAGAGWLYFVCSITWLQDTLAFFAGKSFGRHPMSPSLSPKKTWEGAAGGMAGAILGGILATWLCGLPVPLWLAGLLGIVGGIIGPLGDLAESMVKRQAGIKDAGHLIPGHGGLLDRVDSFLFTAPLIYLLVMILLPLLQ